MKNKPGEKIVIRLRSFNHQFLVSSCRKIRRTLDSDKLYSFKMVTLPTSKKIYCVLRSPHVDKDSREHFEIRIHKRVLEIHHKADGSIVPLLKEVELHPSVFAEINF